MQQLIHDNIVRVYDPDGSDGRYHYFIMELVRGADLRALVLGKRLQPDRIMPLITALAGAIEFAHGRGYIHRDIKPANILIDELDEQFVPKLTDFDLVGGEHMSNLTETGTALGTFLYGAPELFTRPREATTSADVYALGTTLMFALRGEELPMSFHAERRELIRALDCSASIKAALARATNPDPGKRFSRVPEFLAALDAPPPARELSTIVLRFISGKYQGGEFPIDRGREIIIGRSSDLDMVLVEEMVSRRHAKVSFFDDLVVEDLGSSNGTFVNGERVQRAVLKDGDRILIGTSILRVVVPPQQPEPW
jgi:serine/threonine protein kinase